MKSKEFLEGIEFALKFHLLLGNWFLRMRKQLRGMFSCLQWTDFILSCVRKRVVTITLQQII